MGRQIGMVKIFFKIQKLWQNRRRADGIRVEYFPRIQYVAASVKKSNVYFWNLVRPENVTGRTIFMSMFNGISCGSRDNEKECMSNADLVSLNAKRFWKRDNGHSLVLVQRKSSTVSVKTVHKEYGTILLKGCWLHSQKGDVQFSALRAHCLEVDSKAKDMENCRFTMQPILETVETIFRIIVSASQLSLYGAVADICEEYESLHERTGRSVVMGANEFFTRAQCDQDRSSFGLWWPSEPRSSTAAIWRTNWKAVTRQIE